MSCIATTQYVAQHGRLLLVASLAPREIGKRIARARDRKGWTQLAFALEANVSPSTVQRWEAGKLPPVRELMRIADLLGVEPDELVESDDATQQHEAAVQELADRLDGLEGRLDRILVLLEGAQEG